jgi:hypothetical protein
MTEIRDRLVNRIYRGNDPFAGFPAKLYATDMQGWNSSHFILPEAARLCDPITIAEIGVWKGSSTIAMAQSLKDAGANGVVISIDTWLGSPEHWQHDGYFSDLRFSQGYPSLIKTFMANVIGAGLEDYVLPIPLDSINASKLLWDAQIRPDVIHLDGGHEYEPVSADIRVWWPLLRQGGMFIGDDYDPNGAWKGVKLAFDEFASRKLREGQLQYQNGKCWFRKS